MYFKPSEGAFYCPDQSAVDDRGECKSFCHKCQKHVHHVDRMTREDAEAIRGPEHCKVLRLDSRGKIAFKRQPTEVKILLAISMSVCFLSSYAHYAEFTSDVVVEAFKEVYLSARWEQRQAKFKPNDSVVMGNIQF